MSPPLREEARATGIDRAGADNLAAIDCGTLSTRLLVSTPAGAPLQRRATITHLGEGVDRSGYLSPAGVERALGALRDYRRVMDGLGVARARMVGTSALRDAANRDVFSERAASVMGVELELLAGEAEAELSFAGATGDLPAQEAPYLVADIGGGSTELVSGPEPWAAVSLDLGCVRVAERFFRQDPPTADELAHARRFLEEQYRHASTQAPALARARCLVGLAGTVSALACVDLGLRAYDRRVVHHHRLSRRAVDGALGRLAALPAQARSSVPGIEPARAPFILAGTVVLSMLMAFFGFDDCTVSEADILDGLVLTLVARGRPGTAAGSIPES